MTAVFDPWPQADPYYDVNLRRRTRFDRILIALAVALALVLASVPIRNSDVWVHLASGRHLVHTLGNFGHEPFTHTTAAPPGHPSWLFDVLAYACYSVLGSVGLGAAQALLVALLAAALAWAGWAGGGWWVPVLFTTLTLLACTPALQLGPLLNSLVLFALTLGYLERRTAVGTNGWRSYWPLYVLFVLWVNFDAWFLLGPLALACYGLSGRVPWLAVPVGFLVCLVNPHFHGAFQVPADLLLHVRQPELADDPVFSQGFLAPLQTGYHALGQGRGLATLAIVILIAAGITAAVLNRAHRHWPRLLVVAGLLALGLYHARALPLLAVALGVLVPRALRAAADARFREAPGIELRLRQAVVGRFGTIVAGVALVVLAALGRLQPGPPEPRAWGVEADPSLVRAAEEIAAWHRAGKLDGASRGFPFSPDVADYLAWFGPEEKGFLDSRLEVSAPAAADFVAVRQGLIDNRSGDWGLVFRRRRIDHVLLAEPDRGRLQTILERVLAAPDEWTVLFQTGRVLVLAWHDPLRGGAVNVFREGQQDPGVFIHGVRAPLSKPVWIAADIANAGLHPSAANRAPAAPKPPPDAAAWWAAFLPSAVPPSLDRDEALLQLAMFDALRGPTAQADKRTWQLVLAAGAAGQGSGSAWPGPLGAVLRAGWLPRDPAPAKPSRAEQFADELQSGYLRQRDDAPPGYLWAAIRACRRALADHPDGADAYLLLGEAYFRLVQNTPERTWDARLPLLTQLHRLQAVNALQHALRLRPGLDRAHTYLVALYREMGYLDLALYHLQEHLTIVRARGPQPGEPFKEHADRLLRIRKSVEALEQEVWEKRNAYERQQQGLSDIGRAYLLKDLGLVTRALDLLLHPADPEAPLGRPGVVLELELLLAAGRSDEARAWLEPSHRAILSEFDYQWLKVRLAAIAGDYQEADEDLQELLAASPVFAPELGPQRVDLEQAVVVTVAVNVLAGTSPHFGVREPWLRLAAVARHVRHAAEIAVLRGSLTLELGDAMAAERQFRRALVLTRHELDRPPQASTSLRPIASHLLGLLSAKKGGG